ncbi:helix-turn-helix domain-containing protein [Paenibacillus ferrarius]|uniref:helix-turn-helix domain-containing protein n=1 Tax=Paenibacillus ferrarius TaxID=1469647 RepID=UPI003D299EE0
MLRDIERKVLAILRNFSAARRRMPTLKELSTKTGKRESEIVFTLNKLQEVGYIEWDGKDPYNILIIKGWAEVLVSNKDSLIGKM